MQTEIEASFLNIKPDIFRPLLKKTGAILIQKETLMKRKVFDYPDKRLRTVGGWVRVRDEGTKITVSYKQLTNRTIHGTKEVIVTVDNFDNAVALLEAIGLKQNSYQETKREIWRLDDCEITIDTWPWIPTFTEIEGENEKAVKDCALKLGLDWPQALFGSVENIYQTYYKLTEEEIDQCTKITFTPTPAWIKNKAI